MTATFEEIRDWLDEAKKNPENTHVIIGLDPFDYENFPVEVKGGPTACSDEIDRIRKGGNLVNEVYSLSLDIDAQLDEKQAWHVYG